MFYCIAWFGWMITTFFMKKKRKRMYMSIFLLLVIIGAQKYISIFGFYISLGGICIFLYGILLIVLEKYSSILLVVYGGIMGMIYCIFHFFIMYNPILIEIPQDVILLVLLLISSFILMTSMKRSVAIFIVGSFQGDLLTRFFLREYEVIHIVGSVEYLTIVIAGIGIFSLLEGLVVLVKYFTVEKYSHGKGMSSV